MDHLSPFASTIPAEISLQYSPMEALLGKVQDSAIDEMSAWWKKKSGGAARFG